MHDLERGPDPVVDSDRLKGTTPPELGDEGESVTGRPAVEPPPWAFHQRLERPNDEMQEVSKRRAVEDGGSFDAIAPLDELENPDGSDASQEAP